MPYFFTVPWFAFFCKERGIILLLFFGVLSSISGQESKELKSLPFLTQPKVAKTAELIEVSGSIMNATFSRGGYDFYIYFTHHWAPPVDVPNYHVVIKEYPARGRTLSIGIEVNEKQIFTRRLQPSAAGLEALARALVEYVNGYLKQGKHVFVESEFPEISEGGHY